MLFLDRNYTKQEVVFLVERENGKIMFCLISPLRELCTPLHILLYLSSSFPVHLMPLFVFLPFQIYNKDVSLETFQL